MRNLIKIMNHDFQYIMRSLFLLISLTLVPQASLAATATANASVGPTTVSVTASGSFASVQTCDPNNPSNCWTSNDGTVGGTLDGTSIGTSSGTGSASVSATYERATMSQGNHTFVAWATDGQGSASNSTTFAIDNAPVVSFTSPSGAIRGGSTPLAGTVTFVPRILSTDLHGTVYVNYRQVGTSTWNRFSFSNVYSSTFDLSTLASLPTQTWSDGDWVIMVSGQSANGVYTTVYRTITVNNSPVVSLTSPSGGVRGGPTPFVGTVDFAPVSPAGSRTGTVYVNYRQVGTSTWNRFSFSDVYSSTFDLSTLASLPTQTWSDGDWEIMVSGQGSNGVYTTVYRTITVNNSPVVSFTSPSGTIRSGPTPLVGTVDFAPVSPAGSRTGTVYVNYRQVGTSTWNAFSTSDVYSSTFDLSTLSSLPAQNWSNGDWDIKISALGSNGDSTVVTQRITLDSWLDFDQASLGKCDQNTTSAQCQAQTTRHPIRLATGDKEQIERDFTIGSGAGALSMVRSYHSRSTHNGSLGYGWTWTYDWQLGQPNAQHIAIRRADGKLMSFVDDGTGVFRRQLERGDETVMATTGGWRYTRHDRSYVDFDTMGRLLAIYAEDGKAVTMQYDVNGNLASITSPFGRQLTVATDASGHITGITDPLGRTWSYGYDAAGNLASVTNPDTTTRQYQYQDANDPHNLTGIIDEAGRQYKHVAYDTQDRAILSELPLVGISDSVAYNTNGTVDVTDANGTVRHYTISKNGYPSVISKSNGVGGVETFTLDSATNLLMADMNENGVAGAYTYDANGRLLTRTEAVGTSVQRTTSYAYDAAGHVTSTTDALGNVTTYTYDAAGHVTSTTDALGHMTQWSWNANGTLASLTEPNGGVTSYTYDTLGQVSAITHPDSTSRSFTYDAGGRLATVTDEAGAMTTYTYDARDHLLSASFADGSSVSYTYDAAGDPATSTDTAGLVTTYTYDVMHRPVSIVRPDNTSVTSTFDTRGNLTASAVLDAVGATVTSEAFGYDADNRRISNGHADNSSTAASYDMVGNLLTSTDEAMRVTTNSYDALNRLVASTNPNNELATTAYDAMDRPVRVTAANGVTTTYAYDALGRITQEASADRGTISYTYSTGGDLASRTDGNNVVTNYSYDSMHRLMGISYPADTARNVSFTYDAAGRVATMTDASGTTAYSHDVMGRTTQVAWTPAGSSTALNLVYSYDAAGRVATITYPSGRSIAYSYGTDGRIASVSSGTTTLVSGIAYNALNEITGRTLGNGITESHSYDNRGRLTAITAGSVLNRALTWSAQSTVTGVADSVNPPASQSFSYDAVDRLTAATGGYGTLGYTYDANGNRLSRTDAGGTASYAYTANSNRLTQAGATAYVHDAAGNRTNDGVLSYTYGGNNRLIAIADSLGNPVAGYAHNGLGERVKKTVGGVTTLFVYDLSGNLIGEYDGTGALVREHAYGPSGRLASFDATGNTYWYHNNHLGTPQALTNAAGTVVWTMSQTPFGIATVNEDPDGDGTLVTNNFRFPGQYYDAESGLNYNMNRDYDPALGRYIQSDPIGLNGGMNLFGYVGGNPISGFDPFGLRQYSNPAEASAMATAEAMGQIPGQYPNNPQDINNITMLLSLGAPIVRGTGGNVLAFTTFAAHVASGDWNNALLDVLGFYGQVMAKWAGISDKSAGWIGYITSQVGSLGIPDDKSQAKAARDQNNECNK